MRKCTDDELRDIFIESELDLFKNSVCIDPDSDMYIQGNYNNFLEYIVPYISVVECKNTTENGHKCASKDMIQKFIRTTQFVMTTPATEVLESIYEDTATFKKDGQYFPVKTSVY